MLTENLRFFRKSFKLTQQEVADILGVDRSTYTFYETGKTSPTLQNLKKLCDIYNITLGHLCGYEENNPDLKFADGESVNAENLKGLAEISKNEKFILMAYRSLAPEKKKEFLEKTKIFLKN